MRIPLFICSSFLFVFLLSACGERQQEPPGLTAFPEAAKDPGDARLMADIREYIAAQKGPPNSRFQYARLDMNGDGLREGLVLFTLPHSYWCGPGECSMTVFKAQHGGFSLLSEITRIRGPLVVSEHKTNGWRDIIVRMSGVSMSDRNVALRFDGQGYPTNPMTQTKIQTEMRDIQGERLFP